MMNAIAMEGRDSPKLTATNVLCQAMVDGLTRHWQALPVEFLRS